jgi:hypothetical protein
MNRFPRAASVLAAVALLSACTSTPATTGLVDGQQATLTGDVVAVDTAPWAYDGHAVVTVATATAGTVKVQLPARWNLCKAPPPDDVQALQPGDRVEVVGAVTGPGELVVCERPQHRLRKQP